MFENLFSRILLIRVFATLKLLFRDLRLRQFVIADIRLGTARASNRADSSQIASGTAKFSSFFRSTSSAVTDFMTCLSKGRACFRLHSILEGCSVAIGMCVRWCLS